MYEMHHNPDAGCFVNCEITGTEYLSSNVSIVSVVARLDISNPRTATSTKTPLTDKYSRRSDLHCDCKPLKP